MNYWIFKRGGSTRWTFAWAPDPNNKQKRKQVLMPEHLKTEREAHHYAEQHEAELKGTQPKPRARGITVADVIDRWEKLRGGDERFAASTFKDALSHLRRWVVPQLGTLRPEQLDPPTLRAWVRGLSVARSRRGQPLAPYTVRNVLRALTWLLDDVIGEGWATIPGGNPARARAVHSELPEQAPLAGRSQKLRLHVTADAQRLISSTRLPLERRVRYTVGLTAGLRDGEVSGLKWADLDLDGGLVHVRQALQLKTRAGGARLGRTKTRMSKRTVPLHPAAVDALREWRAKGWEIHVGHAPGDLDPVFASPDGKHFRPRSADQFRADLGAAGLPTHIDGHPLTFHALRRSFASWLRAAQVPPEVRQVLMGHVPKTAEERHYSEEDPQALAEHVAKIDLRWNTRSADHGMA